MIPLLNKILALLLFAGLTGCGAYQPTKNVWKSTKGLWNDYVSPPASVDFDDKGDLPEEAKQLSHRMIGIDIQLAKLERAMQNADKPPTQQWLDKLFETFPWLNGFAGVKNDGTILGQQPADSMKELDFVPLLYEDKKQNSRALRTDVQPTPLGPEVFLATPLYDGPDFLGVVVAYFDMRNLVSFSNNPEDLVVLCPTALLWPGKYEFAATPMAGLDWAKIARESSSGVCSNSNGSFFYVIRYLGNLPLIFASVKSGSFPEGDGAIEQGYAFFPQEREKLPVPPVAERRSPNMREASEFGHNPDEIVEEPESPQTAENRPDPNEIEPGSSRSALLRKGETPRRELEERDLEGENARVEIVNPPRRPSRSEALDRQIEILRRQDQLLREPADIEPPLEATRPSPFGPGASQSDESPSLPGGRPSPFGPREATGAEAGEAQSAPTLPGGRPSPFGPREESGASASESEIVAPTLPGGRPSPFGPRREETSREAQGAENPAGETAPDLSSGVSSPPEPTRASEPNREESGSGSSMNPGHGENKEASPFSPDRLKAREGSAPLEER